MGIETVLLIINNCRKDLNVMYKVEIARRNIEWQEKVKVLKINYQNELKQIQFGKINSTFKSNFKEISKASENKLINDEQLENLTFNNKISRIRDFHPVLYYIQNNKIYYTVQTSQAENIPKPLQDESDVNTNCKESINVIDSNDGKYLTNAIYVIEAKNTKDLFNIIENVEENTQLKNKFLSDKKDIFIYSKKEKAFELFYKNLLKEDAEILLENTFLVNKYVKVENTQLIDVTFNKYVEDNLHRISNYEGYRNESWMFYLKTYEIDDIKNINDPTDI